MITIALCHIDNPVRQHAPALTTNRQDRQLDDILCLILPGDGLKGIFRTAHHAASPKVSRFLARRFCNAPMIRWLNRAMARSKRPEL